MEEIRNYNPPLVAMLMRAEELKGKALSESEVLNISESVPFEMMPKDVVKSVSENRGYDDIDYENVWAEWQQYANFK